MAILNYTTKIDSYKTITEIQKTLGKHGANKMIIDTDLDGNPTSLTFCISWGGMPTAFNLPCNFEGVLKALKYDTKVAKKLKTEEQALRVGWRILKDWVEAQLAIVKADMASIQEVFLPYVVTKTGTTLYKHLEEDKQLLLE